MLDQSEKQRYQRQILISQIGLEGQRKLKNAGVLIAGLGGLGSISAYYLTAAGIGRIRLIDRDVVSLPDLNRQILHTSADVGRPKTDSAVGKLRRLNPHCRIEAYQTDICSCDLQDLLGCCHVVVDATDNAAARRVLNRASQGQKIPFVYGGINGFDGMAATFIPSRSACFACVFPGAGESNRSEAIPVIGPAAGIIASIQSLEAIKLILGMRTQLSGRLLLFRGVEMEFKTIPIEADPLCSVCGQNSGGGNRAS